MKHRSIVILLIAALLWTGMGFFFPAGLEAAEGRGKGAGELPKELKGVRVKDAFIPSAGKPAGVIQSVVGHVVVAREGLRQAYYSGAGDRLYEKDTLFTLKGSRCRFRLNGDDVVTMGEGTKIAISGFSVDKARGKKSSAFKMSNGKAMFYALKLFRYKGAAMTVETPTAVVGVRGTKWGVEIVELDGKPTASLPILVADLSDTGFRHLAQTNQPNVQTNVYSFEGQVQVTSTTTGQTTTLNTGQGLNAGGTGLGGAFQTPPGVAQQFSSDTSAPGGNGGASTSGTTTTGSTTTTTGGGTTTTTTPDTSTVAQNQTTQNASNTGTDPAAPDPGTNASGSNVGYVSGMLTKQTGSSLAEIFVSQNRQDFDVRIWARGATDTLKDYIRVDSSQTWSEDYDAYAKWVMFDSGAKNSGDLGTSHPISHTTTSEVDLDSSQLGWGYWTMSNFFTVDGLNYAIDNKGWWINGPNTTVAQMGTLTGSATYSGKAYGTYWSSSGGADMTGSFSSDVNFGNGAIGNFALTVSYSEMFYASISGATGSIGTDGHFNITGGTWNLNGTTNPAYKMAYGSLYGSSASYMGGAWGMATASAGATGIFVGDKEDHYGYFVGMLSRSSGTHSFVNFSMTQTIQDFRSSAISADDPFTTGHAVTVDGSSNYQDPTIKTITVMGDSWTGSAQVVHEEIGSNAYMEWGSWTQPVAMVGTEGGETPHSYYYENKGYYVNGARTTNAQMALLTGSATYSGNAYGTYWTSLTGTDMTGTFSADVNFGTKAISNFNMSVKDNPESTTKIASITGASGSFAGSSSQFTITGGTASITCGSTPQHITYGSVYGPSGQAMGGVWAIQGGSAQAAGVFQGTK